MVRMALSGVTFLGCAEARAITLAHWRFEEGIDGSGSTGGVPLAAHHLRDTVGSHHATAIGTGLLYVHDVSQPSIKGAPNALSVDFDAASKISIGLDAFSATELDQGTIEAFFKPTSLDQQHVVNLENVLILGWSHSFPGFGIGKFAAEIYGSEGLAASGRTYLDVDRWYHLAMTWDQASLKLYVDGVLDATDVTIGHPILASSNDNFIGDRVGGGFNASGLIDEVRISSVALEPYQFLNAELPGDYNASGAVDAADYVVWRNQSGQAGAGLAADGNSDGVVNQEDYNLWRAHFGQAAGSGSSITSTESPTGVPEPSPLILAATASVIFLCPPGQKPRSVRQAFSSNP
jgi:hypothetical protein